MQGWVEKRVWYPRLRMHLSENCDGQVVPWFSGLEGTPVAAPLSSENSADKKIELLHATVTNNDESALY